MLNIRGQIMIGIGIVGVGFMGRIHALALKKVPGARLSAIASRDPAKRAGDWSATRGNFGPPPGLFELTGVQTHATLEELLADPAVDLVDICTPTDQHPGQVIQALEAGKHVLVEKAIALTADEAEAMIAAAERSGQLLMVGHVLPFFPEFDYAASLTQSGDAGRLLGGHLTRVIAAPDWSPEMADASKTGGPAVDLHIHDAHFVGLLAGNPDSVESVGVIGQGGAVDYLSTIYRYSDGPALSCSSGAVATAGRPFAHGFELYFEHATLSYHSGGVPLTRFGTGGEAEVVKLPGGDDPLAGFTAELTEAMRAVETHTPSRRLSARLAADALALCHAEIASVKSGKPVAFGPCR